MLEETDSEDGIHDDSASRIPGREEFDGLQVKQVRRFSIHHPV